MTTSGASGPPAARRGLRRWAVDLLLAVAGLHLVLVLLGHGYSVRLGPLHASVHEFRSTLLVFLAAALLEAWQASAGRGLAGSARSRSPALLFFGLLFVYNLGDRPIWADDAIPARLLPLSVLRELDLDLDEFTFLDRQARPFFVQRVGDHVVSTYPPWGGVLAVPVYVLPVLGGISAESPRMPDLEKLAASLMVALSAVVLLFALRHLTREPVAWAVAFVYGLGTASFSTSSQALWQHGPSQLLVCLGLYALLRGEREPAWAGYAGLPLAAATLCRPIDLLFLLAAGAYVALHRRSRLRLFLLGVLPPAVALLLYDWRYFGSPWSTGVASTVVGPSGVSRLAALFSTPLGEGLAGILVSPGRGLFVYSPVLLLSLAGLVQAWTSPGRTLRPPSDRGASPVGPRLLRYLSLSVPPFLWLTAKWQMWWGGWSYGPRLLADLTPLLCLYLVLPFERWSGRRAFRFAAGLLVALSIGLHALGVFSDETWNGQPLDVDTHPERLWSWSQSPPVYYLGRWLKR